MYECGLKLLYHPYAYVLIYSYSISSSARDLRLISSAFNVLKYRSIGELSYGRPALLILCVIPLASQNSTNSFEVN